MRKTREVALFICRGDRFLLAHRVPQRVWNVIAGQVEDDESFAVAAARELEEETGLVATPIDLELAQNYAIEPEYLALYAPGDTTVAIQSFAVSAPADWEPTLNHEHDSYRWCTIDEAIALAYWPEVKAGLRVVAARLGIDSAG
jgi:8-oxo-dGTP pyrophosphatase MutT (NUDIX family)